MALQSDRKIIFDYTTGYRARRQVNINQYNLCRAIIREYSFYFRLFSHVKGPDSRKLFIRFTFVYIPTEHERRTL
jgi:hypothetical protein